MIWTGPRVPVTSWTRLAYLLDGFATGFPCAIYMGVILRASGRPVYAFALLLLIYGAASLSCYTLWFVFRSNVSIPPPWHILAVAPEATRLLIIGYLSVRALELIGVFHFEPVGSEACQNCGYSGPFCFELCSECGNHPLFQGPDSVLRYAVTRYTLVWSLVVVLISVAANMYDW